MNKMASNILTVLVILAISGCIFASLMVLNMLNVDRVQTINLTINHLWVEDNEYYFADNNGSIYQLGNYRAANDKILYNDMPKQRFEKLNVDSSYEVEYVSKMDWWISINEKEIK